MFGSLVVVLPTPHEGGALVLREDGREWTFDYAAEIANATKIAYVAFFGDIEHEVLTVKSGYRVTLTYNLYSDVARTPSSSTPSEAASASTGDTSGSTEDEDADEAEEIKGKNEASSASAPEASLANVGEASLDLAPTLPQSVVDEEARLRAALQTLLQDPALLPKGGYLAFGLRFMYPLDRKSPLQDLIPHMKGIDARVVRVCRSLGLEGQLKVVYEDDTEYEGNPRYGYYRYDPVKGGEQGVKLAMHRFVNYDQVYEGDTFGEYLLHDGAVRVRNMGTEELHREDDEDEHIPSTEALWVTELTKINRVENQYSALFLFFIETYGRSWLQLTVAYGNEADLTHEYGYLAYFVNVKREAN